MMNALWLWMKLFSKRHFILSPFFYDFVSQCCDCSMDILIYFQMKTLSLHMWLVWRAKDILIADQRFKIGTTADPWEISSITPCFIVLENKKTLTYVMGVVWNFFHHDWIGKSGAPCLSCCPRIRLRISKNLGNYYLLSIINFVSSKLDIFSSIIMCLVQWIRFRAFSRRFYPKQLTIVHLS